MFIIFIKSYQKNSNVEDVGRHGVWITWKNRSDIKKILINKIIIIEPLGTSDFFIISRARRAFLNYNAKKCKLFASVKKDTDGKNL